MEPIRWIDDFSVGVARFDEQHKQLIQMLNRLIAKPQVATGSEAISDLLNDMTSYAQRHFAAEELLMQQHGYPHITEHAAQHNAFRRKTADFCLATMGDVQAVPETILEYLRDWLLAHILKSDMAYKTFFNDLGIE